MTVLNICDFISERIKLQPITNAELDKAQKEFDARPPFGLTKNDLVGAIQTYPMGIVVRMMEETVAQRRYLTENEILETLQTQLSGAFAWHETKEGADFWRDIIIHKKFGSFFEHFPDYKKYNVN